MVEGLALLAAPSLPPGIAVHLPGGTMSMKATLIDCLVGYCEGTAYEESSDGVETHMPGRRLHRLLRMGTSWQAPRAVGKIWPDSLLLVKRLFPCPATAA